MSPYINGSDASALQVCESLCKRNSLIKNSETR